MIYEFDRFRHGIRMAEGAKIHRANSEEEALEIARRLFHTENEALYGLCGCQFEFKLRRSYDIAPQRTAIDAARKGRA